LVPICHYCLNCPKFGQWTLRKIIKIVASRCQISRLKCTKCDFGWDSAPDPTGGAYTALPDPIAGLRGPTSKGSEGKGREGKGKGKGMEGEGGKREGRKKVATPTFWTKVTPLV